MLGKGIKAVQFVTPLLINPWYAVVSASAASTVLSLRADDEFVRCGALHLIFQSAKKYFTRARD